MGVMICFDQGGLCPLSASSMLYNLDFNFHGAIKLTSKYTF